MSNAINKSKSDQQRLSRICKCYDCIPINIPSKVIFPGGWEIPRRVDLDEIRSFEIDFLYSSSNMIKIALQLHIEKPIKYSNQSWKTNRQNRSLKLTA